MTGQQTPGSTGNYQFPASGIRWNNAAKSLGGYDRAAPFKGGLYGLRTPIEDAIT